MVKQAYQLRWIHLLTTPHVKQKQVGLEKQLDVSENALARIEEPVNHGATCEVISTTDKIEYFVKTSSVLDLINNP